MQVRQVNWFFMQVPQKLPLLHCLKPDLRILSAAENLCPTCTADMPGLTNTCLKVKSVGQSSTKEKLPMLETYKETEVRDLLWEPSGVGQYGAINLGGVMHFFEASILTDTTDIKVFL